MMSLAIMMGAIMLPLCPETVPSRNVFKVDPDKDPQFNGPSIAADDYRGSGSHNCTCLGPRASEYSLRRCNMERP